MEGQNREEYEIEGVAATLILKRKRVVLRNKGVMGFLTHGLKGDREIPIKNISAVEFKRAGAVVSGYLRFSVAGTEHMKGGVLKAAEDENSILFVQPQEPNFVEVKRYIDSVIDKEPIDFDTLKFEKVDVDEQAMEKLKAAIEAQKETVASKKKEAEVNKYENPGSGKRIVAAILAILLGGWGAHKFFVGDIKKGVLYLVFIWTLIPTILGIVAGVQYLVMTDEEFYNKHPKMNSSLSRDGV